MPSRHSQILPSEEASTAIFRSITRRTSSFSASSDSSFTSSSFSFTEDYPQYSPSTHLKLKGIPFSWEKVPGLPKQQRLKDSECSVHLLPLPPAKKLHNQEAISSKRYNRRDPFFAALVECSKDNNDRGMNYGSKITRGLSDRFGFFGMYNSCKTACVVSDAVVYLPRASRPHSVFNRRRS